MRAPQRTGILVALGCLYLAQGIPFGFATEYLPVVLRERGFSYAAIAALSWLQLPWQLKIFWARAADSPRLRARTRIVILAMQLALTANVAAFALRPLHEAATLWFALTAVAAAIAATQDVFVDAFAVRVLHPGERGFGNTAQVAGYRVGMLIGGAALLMLVGTLGERTTLLACAAVVALASVGAFVSSEDASGAAAASAGAGAGEAPPRATPIAPFVRSLFRREALVVIVIAATFKLGLHMASSILKPMAVDYGWTKKDIGLAVVTFGTAAALAGAVAGGVLHRVVKEQRALVYAALFQAAVCVPLVLVDRLHAPYALTTFAIALEHFASGLGTTVLFAALMSATRPADAGLHYTVLTSANALAIGIGGLLGGVVADLAGKSATFVVATIASLAPLFLLRTWDEAAAASRS